MSSNRRSNLRQYRRKRTDQNQSTNQSLKEKLVFFFSDFRKEFVGKLKEGLVSMIATAIIFLVAITTNLLSSFDSFTEFLDQIRNNQTNINQPSPEPINVDFKYLWYFFLGVILVMLVVFAVRSIVNYRNKAREYEDEILHFIQIKTQKTLDKSSFNPNQE